VSQQKLAKNAFALLQDDAGARAALSQLMDQQHTNGTIPDLDLRDGNFHHAWHGCATHTLPTAYRPARRHAANALATLSGLLELSSRSSLAQQCVHCAAIDRAQQQQLD